MSNLCDTLDYLCHFLKTFSLLDTFQLTERGQKKRHYLLNPGIKVGKENNVQALQCCDAIFTNLTSILQAGSTHFQFLDTPEHPKQDTCFTDCQSLRIIINVTICSSQLNS
jgi:hypothetical protein